MSYYIVHLPAPTQTGCLRYMGIQRCNLIWRSKFLGGNTMRKWALAIIVCLILVENIFPRPSISENSENEDRAFEALKTSLKLSAVIKDKVWPGFDLNKYAFVLTDPQSGAYLVGFDKAPDNASPV